MNPVKKLTNNHSAQNNTQRKHGIKEILFPNKAFWKQIFRFSIPIALQNLSIALLAIIDLAFISSMGENSVAAVSLASQVTYVTGLISFGISSGASVFLARAFGACVTLGHMIGEKQYYEVKRMARQYAVAGVYVGVFIMLLMMGINKFYVNAFFPKLSFDTKQLAQWLIMVYALYMPFRSLASSLIMGVLRAGGDGSKAMLYDVLPVYLWSLPLGFLGGMMFHWGIVPLLLVMQFKRVIKSALAVRRLLSDKWLRVEQ